MAMINNNNEEKITQERREERGLFQASSFLGREIQKIIKNNESLGIILIVKAHKILFHAMGGADAAIGGVFRNSNDQELKRIDVKTVSIGKRTYFASQTVSIVNNELDRIEDSANNHSIYI